MDITGKPQRSHSPHNHVPSTTTFNKKKPRKTSLSSSTSSKLALLHALEEIRLRRVWKESKPVDSVRNHQPGGARRKANQCGRGGAERSIGRIRVRSCAPVANGLMPHGNEWVPSWLDVRRVCVARGGGCRWAGTEWVQLYGHSSKWRCTHASHRTEPCQRMCIVLVSANGFCGGENSSAAASWHCQCKGKGVLTILRLLSRASHESTATSPDA